MSRADKISLVMPAYNEEANIARAVEECEKVLPKIVSEYEIIIVNDGSADKTGQIAENLAKQNTRLKAVSHEKNTGIGAAIRTGIKIAKYDYIFVIPSDLQFDISELEIMLRQAEGADIVAGYRVSRNYSFYRWMNTKINLFLLSVLFGLKVRDPNWVKIFRKEIFNDISIKYDGFFWDSQVLIDARKKGYIIREAPVHIRDRVAGKASGSNPVRVLKTFLEMVKYWMNQK